MIKLLIKQLTMKKLFNTIVICTAFCSIAFLTACKKDKNAPVPLVLMGWQLNETNTGTAGVGIDRNSLPLYEPPASQVQYGTWYVPAGTVISEKRIEVGGIVLSAGSITFERCWFHPLSIGKGLPLIHNEQKSPALQNVFRNCDIDGSAIDITVYTGLGTSAAIMTENILIEGCYISHFGSGVAIGGNSDVTLKGTYIHDLIDTEYNPGEWSHSDGFTIRSFGGTEAIIKNNRINAYNNHCTGAFFLQATWADSYFDHILLEGNLLEGNGYNAIIEKSNGNYGTDIRAVNNRFKVDGFGTGYIVQGPGWAQWQNNYRNDPSLKDNIGAVIPEPLTQNVSGLTSPANLLATAASAGSVNLSWQSNSESKLGFKIMRSTDNATFTSITITNANSNFYTDRDLVSGTIYYYRVATVNETGISNYSNTATITAQ
jgi:hypothetical protein